MVRPIVIFSGATILRVNQLPREVGWGMPKQLFADEGHVIPSIHKSREPGIPLFFRQDLQVLANKSS